MSRHASRPATTRIIVIEDDDYVREVTEMVLAAAAHSVRATANGLEAPLARGMVGPGDPRSANARDRRCTNRCGNQASVCHPELDRDSQTQRLRLLITSQSVFDDGAYSTHAMLA
jgi:hypothetical protein